MRKIVIWIGLGLSGLGLAQSEEQGKALFQQRCAACHKLNQKLIGPALAGIGQRRDKAWFAKFVANSQALIQAGDKAAIEVYEAYNKQVMPPHPDLSEQDLEALWAYLNSNSMASNAPAQAAPPSSGGSGPTQVIYPGEARPLSQEDADFLRQTFWLLVGMTVGVTLLLGLVIHAVSVRRQASGENRSPS